MDPGGRNPGREASISRYFRWCETPLWLKDPRLKCSTGCEIFCCEWFSLSGMMQHKEIGPHDAMSVHTIPDMYQNIISHCTKPYVKIWDAWYHHSIEPDTIWCYIISDIDEEYYKIGHKTTLQRSILYCKRSYHTIELLSLLFSSLLFTCNVLPLLQSCNSVNS